MSYILDALRKSDQMRRRSAAPTLPLGPAAAAAPKQPALMFYGLLAFVLLGAGIAIGWLRPWQAAPEVRPPAVAAARLPAAAQNPAPAPPPAAKPDLQTQTAVPAAAPAVAAVAAPAPAPSPVSAPTQGRTQGGEAALERQAGHASPKPVAGPSQRLASAPAEQAANRAKAEMPAITVMTLAELPVAIQQELPPLSTSVHAYSARPAERLVGVNNRLLHEGDELAPGLKLEQITPEGMILSFKGYTFRRGVH